MSERKDDLTQSRLDKLQKIKNLGVNPYPTRYHYSHTTQEATALYQQGEDSTEEPPK